MRFVQRFPLLFKSESIGDLLVTISGTFFSALVGLIFFIVVAHVLGPDNLGVFSAIVAMSVLISDVADLGISAGIAKFVGKYSQQGKTDIEGKFLTLSFILKIFLIIIVASVGIAFNKLLSQVVFNDRIPGDLISLGFFGAIITALFSFANFALQARRKFITFSILNSLGNLARLFILGLVMSLSVISIDNSLQIYFFGLLITGVLAIIFLPAKLLSFLPTKTEWDELFHFNKWLALGVIMFAIFTRIDSILLITVGNTFEAGIYAISTRITFIFPLIAASLSAVWSPRFAALDSKQQARKLFKETVLISLFFGLITIIPIPFGSLIINLLFGSEYSTAISSLTLLFISWGLFILAIPPIQFLTYFYGKSNLYGLLTLFQAIVIISLDFILIPSYGASGAAFAFLIGNFVALVSAYIVTWYENTKSN